MDGAKTALRPAEVLADSAHRDFPSPTGPWALSMRWHDLLFMHWPVPPDALRPHLPPGLRLDAFDGSAWLGVVPFRMTGVRPRLLPEVRRFSDFPELNVRTYVTPDHDRDRPGVWFFSLDAASRLAVRLARATFHLPYFDARMSCEETGGGISYRSVRTHKGAPPARFAARYRPVGGPKGPPDDLERFLTERYRLYAADGKGRVLSGDVHHRLWPLRPAEAEVEELQMTAGLGVELPDAPPLLHFSERLDVLAWPPKRLAAEP